MFSDTAHERTDGGTGLGSRHDVTRVVDTGVDARVSNRGGQCRNRRREEGVLVREGGGEGHQWVEGRRRGPADRLRGLLVEPVDVGQERAERFYSRARSGAR